MSWLRPWLAQPLALALLGLMPLLGLATLLARRQQRRALARFGSPLALRMLTRRSPKLSFLRSACASLGLTALVFGVAGPQWGRDWGQTAARGRDLVVVLDLS